MNIHKNMRMREALRAALDLGVSVRRVNANGEVEFDHELFPYPVRVNSRRNDITQHLASLLRKLDKGCLHNPHRKGAPKEVRARGGVPLPNQGGRYRRPGS